MINRATLVCASVALAMSATALPGMAQTSATPTRSGSLAPAGEGPGAETAPPPARSGKSRASVKAQTRDAQSARTLAPAGPAEDPVGTNTNTDQGRATAPPTSANSRASVKARTRTARSTGSLQPAGEAAQPSNEAPSK